MSVNVSIEDVQVRLEYEEEGEICEFNWLQMNVCHSTIISILSGLGVSGMNGDSYSVKVDAVLDVLARWDGERLNTAALQYKPTDYQNRLILKLGMMAMGCKMKGIEEITWG